MCVRLMPDFSVRWVETHVAMVAISNTLLCVLMVTDFSGLSVETHVAMVATHVCEAVPDLSGRPNCTLPWLPYFTLKHYKQDTHILWDLITQSVCLRVLLTLLP